MSAIDTIDHIVLGYLFNIPVYWAINHHSAEDILDVSIEHLCPVPARDILYVGGGSGEHPAMPLQVSDLMKWLFLNQFDRVDEDDITEESFDPEEPPINPYNVRFVKELIAYREIVGDEQIDKYRGADGMNLRDVIDLNWWPLETYIGLDQLYKINTSQDQKPGDLRTNILLTVCHIVMQTIPVKEMVRLNLISKELGDLIDLFMGWLDLDEFYSVNKHMYSHMQRGAYGPLGKTCGRMTMSNGTVKANYSMADYLANPEIHRDQTWILDTLPQEMKQPKFEKANESLTAMGLAC